jgi:hypothetical protein
MGCNEISLFIGVIMHNHDHLILSIATILAAYTVLVVFVLRLCATSKSSDNWAEDHMSQVPNLIDNRPKK